MTALLVLPKYNIIHTQITANVTTSSQLMPTLLGMPVLYSYIQYNSSS